MHGFDVACAQPVCHAALSIMVLILVGVFPKHLLRVAQVGVFISRSSLRFVKIRRVEILTTLQGINFTLFLLQDFVCWAAQRGGSVG